MYFSGQGKMYVAVQDINGNPGPFRWVGNVPELEWGGETDVFEHKESFTGQRATDLRFDQEKRLTFRAVFEEVNQQNLVLATHGTALNVAGGSVTNEALPTTVAVGDIIRLEGQNISALTVVDSTPDTPVTLTLDTHYRINSADHGSIEILSLAGIVQPLKANYTAGTATGVTMLTGSRPEVWVRFEGLNTVPNGDPVLLEFYRVSTDLLAQMALIGDDLMQMELNGSVLADADKESDNDLGAFGRMLVL
jgi:hypothetical protein